MYFSELSPWGGETFFFILWYLPPLSDEERGRYCCSCLRKVFIFLSHGILLVYLLTYSLMKGDLTSCLQFVEDMNSVNGTRKQILVGTKWLIDWLICFRSLPLFTRYWFGLTVLFTLLGRFGLLAPSWLILTWDTFINQ